jgi:serine/threonine-protein kinase
LPKRYGQTGTWTDVWGFALTMVEVLAGRAPLEGDLQAVMGACLDDRQRPTPRSLGVDVGKAAEEAFLKALAVDPKDRYQDLGEFWDALEAATGVRTPRIESGSTPELDSVAPPRPPAGEVIPDLDLAAVRPKGVGAPKGPVELTELSSGQKPKQPPPPDLSDMPLLGNDARQSTGLDTVLAPPPSGLGTPSLDLADSRPRVHSVGSMPAPQPMRVAAAYSVRGVSVRPSAGALIARAAPAFKILGLAAAIMIADIAYATQTGVPFTLGPARAFWIAGPLGVWGLFKLALALLSE